MSRLYFTILESVFCLGSVVIKNNESKFLGKKLSFAAVAELADAYDSKSYGVIHESSILSRGTLKNNNH